MADLRRIENLLAELKADPNSAKQAEDQEALSSAGITTILNINKTEEGVAIVDPYCKQVNPESRSKEYRDYVEYILSFPRLYSLVPEQYLHHREKQAELIVLPPDEWRISRSENNIVYVDPNWKFLLACH